MKLLSKIAASVALMLVLATVSFAQDVKSDYDHSANFGQYKTFLGKGPNERPVMIDRSRTR